MAGRRAGPLGQHARRLPPRPARPTSRGWPARAARSTTVDRGRRRALRRRTCAPTGGRRPSVARALVAVRTLHRFLAEEGRGADDPAADVEPPRVPAGLPEAARPRTRSTSLLDAVVGDEPVAPPRPGHPRGALRHRRAHLRAVRPVARRPRPRRRAGAGVRQGRQGAHRAARPHGAGGARATGSAPGGRGALGARRGGRAAATPRRCSSTSAAGGCPARAAWAIVRHVRRPGRARRPAQPARAAPLVRHPHARPRRRHPGRAGAARPRLDLDDAGVHDGLRRAAAPGLRRRPPPGRAGR